MGCIADNMLGLKIRINQSDFVAHIITFNLARAFTPEAASTGEYLWKK
jgi:hypothetical protein